MRIGWDIQLGPKESIHLVFSIRPDFQKLISWRKTLFRIYRLIFSETMIIQLFFFVKFANLPFVKHELLPFILKWWKFIWVGKRCISQSFYLSVLWDLVGKLTKHQSFKWNAQMLFCNLILFKNKCFETSNMSRFQAIFPFQNQTWFSKNKNLGRFYFGKDHIFSTKSILVFKNQYFWRSDLVKKNSLKRGNFSCFWKCVFQQKQNLNNVLKTKL